MSKKKILYLLFRADYGGAEQSIPLLIKLYEDLGYKTDLLILWPGGNKYIKNLLLQYQVSLWETLLNKNNYKFIISSIPYSSIPALIFSIILKPSLLFIWLHNSRYSLFHTWLLKIPKYFYKTNYLADSDNVRKAFISLDPHYAPIYYHNFKSTGTIKINKNKFITLARPSVQKGLDILVVIANKFPRINFYIYGSSEIEFKKLYPQIKIPRNINFKGFLEIKNIFKERCFYIQPSRWEGFCISIVEAILYGCIPLGTAVGEIPNHLNQEKAFIFNNLDINEIEYKIKTLINKEDFSLYEAKVSDINKKIFRKYSKETIKKAWKDIFNL